MRRRAFLQSGVAILGAANTFPRASTADPTRAAGGRLEQEINVSPDGYEPPEWLRYCRAVDFEGYSPPTYPHMKDFDATRLVAATAEVGADTLRFAGIAYWAYYPSKVFPVHPELGSRDLVNEVSRECRRRGVHLYIYTGYGAPAWEVGWVDQHPKYLDWVLRGADGKPYGPYPHTWGTRQKFCITGETYRHGIRQVVKEICAHDVDGVYFDGPCGYRGICFCDSCRRSFRKYSGMDIDRLTRFVRKYASTGLPQEWGVLPSDADIEALAAWYDWADELVKEDLLDFRKIIHSSNKFMLCHNGVTWKGGSLIEQYRIPDGFMVEASEQTYQKLATGLMQASMGRPYKKLAQMYMGSYAVTWFSEPPYDKPWKSNDTNREDGEEALMQGVVGLACGASPLYCTGNRLYYHVGSGSIEPDQEVFALMQRAEPILKDSVPVPYVSIVPTSESLQLWRSKRLSWNMTMNEGFALAMLDERISFDLNPSTEMSEEWLARQRVIALCGASGISDSEAARLGDWVRRGGGLLATFDTGLYDAGGQLRHDGGALREVLGAEMTKEASGSEPESYYRVQHAHPSLGEYGVGAIIQGDLRLVPVEPGAEATVLADCWNLGTNESRGPAIVVHSYGKGTTIYVAGSLEGFYTASRIVSMRRVLGSMVRYLGMGAPQPFTLAAPRGVYGMLRRSTNGDLVFWVLANVGFKDADVGLMRQEFMPVSNVEIGIRVPEGRRPRAFHLLRAGRTMRVREEAGYAKVTIPSVHIAELVHLDLS